jgi:hypothetical protein
VACAAANGMTTVAAKAAAKLRKFMSLLPH